MIRRPPRSTLSSSSAASDVYKRQRVNMSTCICLYVHVYVSIMSIHVDICFLVHMFVSICLCLECLLNVYASIYVYVCLQTARCRRLTGSRTTCSRGGYVNWLKLKQVHCCHYDHICMSSYTRREWSGDVRVLLVAVAVDGSASGAGARPTLPHDACAGGGPGMCERCLLSRSTAVRQCIYMCLYASICLHAFVYTSMSMCLCS